MIVPEALTCISPMVSDITICFSSLEKKKKKKSIKHPLLIYFLATESYTFFINLDINPLSDMWLAWPLDSYDQWNCFLAVSE